MGIHELVGCNCIRNPIHGSKIEMSKQISDELYATLQRVLASQKDREAVLDSGEPYLVGPREYVLDGQAWDDMRDLLETAYRTGEAER